MVLLNYVKKKKVILTTQIRTQTSPLPGRGSSLMEVFAEGAPKNCSLRRDSGTGLTMNLRPAEWTTWVVVLGEMPEEINRLDVIENEYLIK